MPFAGWPWIAFGLVLILLAAGVRREHTRGYRLALAGSLFLFSLLYGALFPFLVAVFGLALAAGFGDLDAALGLRSVIFLSMAIAVPFGIAGIGVLSDRRWGYVLAWVATIGWAVLASGAETLSNWSGPPP